MCPFHSKKHTHYKVHGWSVFLTLSFVEGDAVHVTVDVGYGAAVSTSGLAPHVKVPLGFLLPLSVQTGAVKEDGVPVNVLHGDGRQKGPRRCDHLFSFFGTATRNVAEPL